MPVKTDHLKSVFLAFLPVYNLLQLSRYSCHARRKTVQNAANAKHSWSVSSWRAEYQTRATATFSSTVHIRADTPVSRWYCARPHLSSCRPMTRRHHHRRQQQLVPSCRHRFAVLHLAFGRLITGRPAIAGETRLHSPVWNDSHLVKCRTIRDLKFEKKQSGFAPAGYTRPSQP